jgi:prevent-host-death family protein
MAKTYTPSGARAHLFGIIRDVNAEHAPVWIAPARGGPGVVVVAASDWESIEETLYLEATGAMAAVRAREADNTGVTDAAEIDWDNL